jgi:hypothetical protein
MKRLGIIATTLKEWKSCATLVVGGAHSNKLGFGADAKLDEGKGSR